MISAFIFVFCWIKVLVGSEIHIDVRVCYDATGCDRHILSCSDRSTQIIITEAFIGFNCSMGSNAASLCGSECCRNSRDFRCWDVLDIVSIRVLCDSCWRMSSCTTIDLLSPTNRCKTGVHILPVYSIVRYKCLLETLSVVDVDDMCYEYQINPPYPVDHFGTTIATTSLSSSSNQDNLAVTLGIGISVAIVTIVIIVILVYLLLSKRRKPESTEETDIKDVSLTQSQYFVLESRRQSGVSGKSNRNSTYYNTVDDLAVSIISLSVSDSPPTKNSTKRKKSTGRRPSEIRGGNSRKNDNSSPKRDNSVTHSQLTEDNSLPVYINGNYDTLELTSKLPDEKTQSNRKPSIIESDDGYDHLIRGPKNSIRGNEFDDLYSNHKIQPKGK